MLIVHCMVPLAFFITLLSAADNNAVHSHVEDFYSQFGEGKRWADCSHYVVETVPFDSSAFVQSSRLIPDLNISLTRWGWGRGPASKKCFDYDEPGCSPGKMKIRYKVVNRVIYASEVDYEGLKFQFDTTKSSTVHWVHASLAANIEEMLVLAVWLYKDWPDMDLIFTVASGPGRLSSIFSPAGKGNVVQVPRLGFATTGHSYSIPHDKNWKHLAMSELQLEKYTACLRKRFPLEAKRPVVFFRGSPTGYKRGWSNETLQSFNTSSFADMLLANQRTWVALTSRNFPFMDVKLTKVNKLFNDKDPSIRADFAAMLSKPGLPQEEWSKHAFILSMNGHGYTDRVPAVLLSGSLPVLPDSAMKEWFLMDKGSKLAFDDVLWYDEDASDLLAVSKRAVKLWTSDPAGREKLQAMINRTQALASSRFHCLAVLDAFSWSVNHLWRTWCNWKVDLPSSGWRPVKIFEPFQNHFIPKSVWEKVREGMRENFS